MVFYGVERDASCSWEERAISDMMGNSISLGVAAVVEDRITSAVDAETNIEVVGELLSDVEDFGADLPLLRAGFFATHQVFEGVAGEDVHANAGEEIAGMSCPCTLVEIFERVPQLTELIAVRLFEDSDRLIPGAADDARGGIEGDGEDIVQALLPLCFFRSWQWTWVQKGLFDRIDSVPIMGVTRTEPVQERTELIWMEFIHERMKIRQIFRVIEIGLEEGVCIESIPLSL